MAKRQERILGRELFDFELDEEDEQIRSRSSQ